MPNRILKESICTSSTVDALNSDEERFFYRLMVQADDFGRMDARPQIVRARCFPLKLDAVTDAVVSGWLHTCARVGLIHLYTAGGQPYLQFVTWDKHQQVRAKRSRYPDPDSNGYHLISDDGICPRNPIQSESESESECVPAPTALVSVIHPAPKPEGYSAKFEGFWRAYPRRIEKKAAWRVWQMRLREGVDADGLIDAASNYAIAKEGIDPQYIKHAATFLGPNEHYLEYVSGVPPSEQVVTRNGHKGRESETDQLRRLAARFVTPGDDG